MNPQAAFWKFLLVLVFCGGLTQIAVACHDVSTDPKPVPSDPYSRTFLLDLQLKKSGAVRGVQVLPGVGPLRVRAIRAAARRKYRTRPGYTPDVIAVEVKFPKTQNLAPEIREAMVGGVLACIYAGAPIQSPLTTWVNELLSNGLTLPFILPSDSPQQ